ncbi:hypothetical protein SPRG_07300 [Saprolegnia parasitica CBS 223.65]|uniref:A-kinase anchor protein 7-like phosphoesterase domain-containing protein n=1 Tax=Saprolegnia parasitica (strain CBS 223.65) TaxID=695850 RepID=A0A067CEV4_SAPPC|nr:hypothetical protein SPRG_07300 [Saprolegnia parasitica CBS 223.65]KDO27670.1 hypothetical protein SPRG_07300 [Saprolegnia parasitica CBS 223.65]|eukprot:XP_012201482.1 hypothetical protein SPRG_07300 [Saprolegnia parasitica CBS 223.65]
MWPNQPPPRGPPLGMNPRAALLYGGQDRNGADAGPTSTYASGRGGKRSARARPTTGPNAFLCFRITEPSTIARCESIQDAIQRKDARLAHGMISPPKLHCTLLVLRLHTLHDLWRAQAVLRRAQHLLSALFPPSKTVSLNGVSHFDHRVLIATLTRCHALEFLVENLQSELRAAGLDLAGNHAPYIPHVTLCKVPSHASIDPALYGAYTHSPIGVQPVSRLELCTIRGSARAIDGSHPSLYSILNPDIPTTLHVVLQPGDAVLLRGVPGAGKSTLARHLQSDCDRRGLSSVVCTSEGYYAERNSLVFDEVQGDDPDAFCTKTLVRALEDKMDVIVIDKAHLSLHSVDATLQNVRHRRVWIVELHTNNVLACVRRSLRRVTLKASNETLEPIGTLWDSALVCQVPTDV